MKKIFILVALVAFVGSACDGNKANEKGATCKAPKLDGTIQQVSSACTKGADIEHIRVEGLTLKRGQYARFYYNSTDNSGKDGVVVTIRYDGQVSVNNNGDTTSIAAKKLTGPATNPVTNKTVCFDFHNDGGNLHFITWEDKKCDQSYTATVGVTVIDDTTGGPFKANAKKTYYKIDSGAKATLVVAKGAIFKD